MMRIVPVASLLPVPVTPVIPFSPARRTGENWFTLQKTIGTPLNRAVL